MTATTIERPNGRQAERTRCGRSFSPSVDILENKDELLLVADVPGATSENIDIQYENGELCIHAKVDNRDEGVRGDGARQLWREYEVGDYCRTFQVGEAIDSTRIHADVKNGVLTVHLPKTEAVKPKKIAVQIAEG